MPEWIYNDGGRKAAGYKGDTGDCVTRAIAIAGRMDYRSAYNMVSEHASHERAHKQRKGKSSARTGVYKPTTKRIMKALGWEWTPTMKIGSGCTVHLRADELPSGRIVCVVSKHLVAVVDGVVFDTHDPRRGGKRCVYGYWSVPGTR